jgi:hypothetical protein
MPIRRHSLFIKVGFTFKDSAALDSGRLNRLVISSLASFLVLLTRFFFEREESGIKPSDVCLQMIDELDELDELVYCTSAFAWIATSIVSVSPPCRVSFAGCTVRLHSNFITPPLIPFCNS